MRSLFAALMVGLVTICSFDVATAQSVREVTLSPESVEAVAQSLERLVDERAAALNAATERDIGSDAVDHMIVQAINVVTALVLVGVVFMAMVGFAMAGGMRSFREVRDAVDEWRAMLKHKDKWPLAGQVLISGSIVAGFTILGMYHFIASVSTPHG